MVPEWHMLKLWELAAMRGEGKDVKGPGLEGEEAHPNCGNDMFKSIAGGTHGECHSEASYSTLVIHYMASSRYMDAVRLLVNSAHLFGKTDRINLCVT